MPGAGRVRVLVPAGAPGEMIARETAFIRAMRRRRRPGTQAVTCPGLRGPPAARPSRSRPGPLRRGVRRLGFLFFVQYAYTGIAAPDTRCAPGMPGTGKPGRRLRP